MSDVGYLSIASVALVALYIFIAWIGTKDL
jgi:hypothetical protein